MSLEVRDERLALRARAHPLRLRMLSLLTGAALSAAELARELGTSQALASYHLRFLVNAGAVELAEEVTNRGGRERRYRYRPGAGPGDEELGGHELMLAAVTEELGRRHAQRATTGPALTVDAELWVSDATWLAFRDTVATAARRLHEEARRPHAPGTTHVNVTALLFRMEP